MAEQGGLIACLLACKDMKENGVEPNLLIYNDLLKVAAEYGMDMVVEGVMDDMRAMGIEPDRQSYHHLLHVKWCFLFCKNSIFIDEVCMIRQNEVKKQTTCGRSSNE
jgi:hypothetical protein